MDFKIGIVEATDFSEEALNILKEIGRISFFCVNREKLKEFVKDKDCIFVRLNYYYGEELLSGAKKLKYICTPTTGLNHIDKKYAKAKKVKILSLKGDIDFLNSIVATPEHTFGLALSLIRNYNKAFLSPKNVNWDRDLYKGYEMKNMKVGIIGLGRVGNILCKYLKAFGAKVSYFDCNENVRNKYDVKKYENISDLICDNDMIFLCATYNDQNEKMISKRYLEMMKGKWLINTSRGELIDEDSLVEFIENDHFRGVALDVVANETKTNNIRLFISLVNNHNLILTSHIAGATYNSMWRTEVYIAKKLYNARFTGG
jgi:D-3-phosphoglycerate dehydrogenase